MPVEDYRWLVGESAEPYLLPVEEDFLQRTKRLRRKLSATRTHLILEQLDLRGRAESKFEKAKDLFFTRKSLEQATDTIIARLKSARCDRFHSMADLCCGIGGDLFELPASLEKVGIELDPTTSLLCSANCKSLGVSSEIRTQDAATFDVDTVDAWHIDPDRRSEKGRTVNAERFQPPRDVIVRLISKNENAMIKLAPATPIDQAWLQGAELHWIGHDRSCQQLVAYFGDTAVHPNCRVATVIKKGTPTFLKSDGDHNVDKLPVTNSVARYIFEPHAVVLAADLAYVLAANEAFRPLIPGGGYLTSDAARTGDLYSTFQVMEVVPFREKTIREALRSANAGSIEVKKRGIDLNPNELAKRFRGRGENKLTLILYRQNRSVHAAITKRIEHDRIH